MALFLEPRHDKYYNTGMPACVIEGDIVGGSIKVNGPDIIKDRWPILDPARFYHLPDTYGPARRLGFDEYKKIIDDVESIVNSQ